MMTIASKPAQCFRLRLAGILMATFTGLILCCTASVSAAESASSQSRPSKRPVRVIVENPVTVRSQMTPDEKRTAAEDARQARLHEAADLQIQRRSADAAVDQVSLARWNLAIGVLTTIGLIITIGLNIKSTNASTLAASESSKSFLAFIAAERAVLSHIGASLHPLSGQVMLAVRNTGSTTAYLMNLHWSIVGTTGPSNVFDLSGPFREHFEIERTVGANEIAEIPGVALPAVDQGTHHTMRNEFLIVGAYEYRSLNDIFRSPFSLKLNWSNHNDGEWGHFWDAEAWELPMDPRGIANQPQT